MILEISVFFPFLIFRNAAVVNAVADLYIVLVAAVVTAVVVAVVFVVVFVVVVVVVVAFALSVSCRCYI